MDKSVHDRTKMQSLPQMLRQFVERGAVCKYISDVDFSWEWIYKLSCSPMVIQIGFKVHMWRSLHTLHTINFKLAGGWGSGGPP